MRMVRCGPRHCTCNLWLSFAMRLATRTKSSTEILAFWTWVFSLCILTAISLTVLRRSATSLCTPSNESKSLSTFSRFRARISSVLMILEELGGTMRRSGLYTGSPEKTLMGAWFPKLLNFLLFETDCTMGSTSVHSFSFMLNSDSRALQHRRTSRQTRSTVQLECELFGAVKWWWTCSAPLITATTWFLKLLSLSNN